MVMQGIFRQPWSSKYIYSHADRPVMSTTILLAVGKIRVSAELNYHSVNALSRHRRYSNHILLDYKFIFIYSQDTTGKWGQS